MTHELILTSVAQGLDPDDHGFCPVAADSTILPPIVHYLSALDNYHSLAAESDINPVAYSHFFLPDRSERVLSRAAVIGTDDQRQPNVLVHYVLLDELELVPEGPAWILALPGFHVTEWNAPPLRFLQGRPVPTLTNPQSLTRRQQIARQCRWLDPQKMALTGSVDLTSESYLAAVQSNDEQITLAAPPTTPCPQWQTLTGDAGWGGVLAESAVSEQPVVLLYKPGQNILPLFVEALALLPLHSTWRTTFCTHYSTLPNTIPCQWKGAVAGSEQAIALVKDLNNLVIDLTIPMGAALMGKYVDFARHGQESMLPLAAEEYHTILINADTKGYGDEEEETGTWESPPDITPPPVADTVVPSVPSPKRHAGLFESFLHRSSRTQFYLLYSVMFALVLFLLVFLVDQVGEFGIMQRVQNWNQSPAPNLPDIPKLEIVSELDAESELEKTELDVPDIMEDTRAALLTAFAENQKTQTPLLLRFWKDFDFPEFFPLNFPVAHDNQIDVPEKTTFSALSPLYPFGAALELYFIPLFEIPNVEVVTRLVLDGLPHLVWQVEAVDTITRRNTPMFRFQLTEAGLEMDWQPEGLSNQHLYDTILTSLGFLEMYVADILKEAFVQIPLFAPVQTEPVKISDLANRAESETPEYVVESPFASELWQRIFATLIIFEGSSPSKVLRLEVRPEPTEDWLRRKLSLVSEFSAEVHTSQQIGKPTEGGETALVNTAFENLEIPVVAKASLEKVVWNMGDYTVRLRVEEENRKTEKENLEKQIEQLLRRAFEGDESVRSERDKCETDLRAANLRLKEIENILNKLPGAYKELGRNETRRFHYSLFLESAEGERELLILTTGDVVPGN